MKNTAKLTACSIDKVSSEESLVPWLDLNLPSKDVTQEQLKLEQLHDLNKDRTKQYWFKCSCGDNPILIVSRLSSGIYIIRDKYINQHDVRCSLYTRVEQRDSHGEKMMLTRRMLKMPEDTNDKKSTKVTPDISQDRIDASRKNKATFNSLTSTVIDSACSISNSKYETFDQDGFIKALQNQMFKMPLGDDDLSEFQKAEKKRGNKVYFENIIVDEIFVQRQNKAVLSIRKPIGENLANELEKSSLALFKINDGLINCVRGDILYQALQNLRIHNNYIKGPYIITVIKSKKKGSKFYDIPLVNISPIMITNTHILPVESSLERNCMSVITDEFQVKAYKPYSRDKRIYWNQLCSFLFDHTEEKLDIASAYKLCKGEFESPVRPDLFVIYKSKVYVLEITGMMGDSEYVRILKNKEEKFYNRLKKVTYCRASSPEALRDFFKNKG